MPRHEPEMLGSASASSVRRSVLPLSQELVTRCLASGKDPVSQSVAAGLAACMVAAAHYPPDRVLRVVESICEMMLKTTRRVAQDGPESSEEGEQQ